MQDPKAGNIVRLTMAKMDAGEKVLEELGKLDAAQCLQLEQSGFRELIRLELERRRLMHEWNEALERIAKE